jgi:hypothetical protein
LKKSKIAKLHFGFAAKSTQQFCTKIGAKKFAEDTATNYGSDGRKPPRKAQAIFAKTPVYLSPSLNRTSLINIITSLPLSVCPKSS